MNDEAFTPTLKWAIAGLTVLFLGLGTWLGVVVYKNAQNTPAAEIAKAPETPSQSGTLPEPVTTTLEEPKNQSAASEATKGGQTVKAKQEEKKAEPKREQKPAPALKATVATRVSGSLVSIDVVASQAATVWLSQCRVETASGSAGCGGPATKPGAAGREHTLTVETAGARKLVAEVSVRADGQTLKYDVVVENLPGSTQTATPAPQPSTSNFAATASTSSSNGQTWLMVTASEPVRIGVDAAPSGDLATTHRRQVSVGTHTVIVRTADGREQRFSVGGSSSTVGYR